MTQEEKDLLLKDLCARLPYGVKCKVNHKDSEGRKTEIMTLDEVSKSQYFFVSDKGSAYSNDFKPYLRPMVTITEDELEELSKIDEVRCLFSSRHLTYQTDGNVIDYLNKKMFDWRGLIGKELALKAPEGMY